MATGEDQTEAFVGDLVVGGPVEFRSRADQQLLADRRGQLVVALPSAQSVDRAAAGRRDDPSDGVVGRAVAAPRAQGLDPCVLHCLLCEIEVSELPDEHGDRTTVRLAHRSLDDPPHALLPFITHGAGPRIAVCCSHTGRISTVPCSAIGIRAETSIV